MHTEQQTDDGLRFGVTVDHPVYEAEVRRRAGWSVDWLTASDLWPARWLSTRSLAVIYLIAFVNVVLQFGPLLGSRGLMPVPSFVERVSFRRSPPCSICTTRTVSPWRSGGAWWPPGLGAGGRAAEGRPGAAVRGLVVGRLGAVPVGRQRRSGLVRVRVGVDPAGGWVLRRVARP